MDDQPVDHSGSELSEWTRQGCEHYRNLVEMLHAPMDACIRDPFNFLPHLQRYIDELPLDEFEGDDWATLYSDLVAYIAETFIQRYCGKWTTRPDNTVARGFRYLIEVANDQGSLGVIDPFAVVREEARNRPIDIARLLASAELTAGFREIH